MDFGREVERLTAQIPAGRVSRIADVARALGDVRASRAVAAFLADHPDVVGADRVVARGVPVAENVEFRAFAGRAPLGRLRREQRRVASQVTAEDGFGNLDTIAGVDVAYDGERAFVAAVSLDARSLDVIEDVRIERRSPFPYIPTYLAFREAPLIVPAVRRFRRAPSVLLVDGHGRLHPERCGLACLVGVRLDLPTVGVAKSHLVGELRSRKAGWSDVYVDGECLGRALLTGMSTRPIYVSPGHRVSLRTATEIVQRVSRSRIPEPIRLADLNAAKQKMKQKEKGSRRLDSQPTGAGSRHRREKA